MIEKLTGPLFYKSSLYASIVFFSLSVSAIASAQTVGDAGAGQQKAAACVACHGQDGNSAVSSFPKLAGQGERYLVKQLTEIKSGVRKVEAMAGIATNLSEQDMADIAAYFAKQKTTLGGVKKEQLALGQKIYRSGIAAKGVPACMACHGPNGLGIASAGFPALGGQHQDYTVAQLKAFRAAGRGDKEGVKRENDGDSMMMRKVAAKLSDTELEAVANYISGLH